VLSTGGTIAGTGASSTNVAEYKGGAILGEDLVKAVPEIKQFANVEVQQIIKPRSSYSLRAGRRPKMVLQVGGSISPKTPDAKAKWLDYDTPWLKNK
jgi:hypothetical protein